MSILETIRPIQLLRNSHKDTAITGLGCIMNVAAYLNGDEFITDHSPCVHALPRALAIPVNDWLKYEERQALLPLVEKLMRSSCAAFANSEIQKKWEEIAARVTKDIRNVIAALHRATPDLILISEWETRPSFYLAMMDVLKVVYTKQTDLFQLHSLGGCGYYEMKERDEFLQAQLYLIVDIQRKALIEMLNLIPDEEESPIIQDRATKLATIARKKVAVLV